MTGPRERTADSVAGDLVTLACAGIVTEELRGQTAERVRELAGEAVRLGAAGQRRATARACSAWLGLMLSARLPEAGGKSLLEDALDLEPGLRGQLLAALRGEKP